MRTIYWVMKEIGISHRPKEKTNGITKADKPLQKYAIDMTEITYLNGKLYVLAIFDCFDFAVIELVMLFILILHKNSGCH